ncbi:MAG: hypothetical protein MR051_06105 [Lentisphaeria bacterium]|nr:hypothetical protein [Lentisphaeria bacterium]
MIQLHDVPSAGTGRFRAVFAGTDLGSLAAPPVIRATYQSVKMPISDPASASGLGEAESAPRPTGTADLRLYATAAVWNLLSEAVWMEGELRLIPEEPPGARGTLKFPAARLLPEWEFEPAAVGVHGVRIHLRLSADSAGKLFVIA